MLDAKTTSSEKLSNCSWNFTDIPSLKTEWSTDSHETDFCANSKQIDEFHQIDRLSGHIGLLLAKTDQTLIPTFQILATDLAQVRQTLSE